jgi:2-polyprenyl-3-methyl-5-hydroxy-6-metoxy-1,4-benzoquinol methylase
LVDETKNTAELYERFQAQHGDSYKSLNWESQEGQELRFRILSEIGDLSHKKILDVGCGLGHFADWLQKCDIDFKYTGVVVEKVQTYAFERD